VLKKKSTKTSSFGVAKRENHDSSEFYSRKLYDNTQRRDMGNGENPIPPRILDSVQLLDSRDMSVLPDECIHMMVTSPPYNVGKDYDEDLDMEEYRALLDEG